MYMCISPYLYTDMEIFLSSILKCILQTPAKSLYLSNPVRTHEVPTENLPDIIRMEMKYYLCSQFSSIIEEAKHTK